MVVAVVAVRVMQMAVHQIANVIAVWHGLVAAVRPVDVGFIVAATVVVGRATVRVLVRDLDDMFVYVVLMRMVEVTIVNVINMIAMLHGGVAAVRTMRVRVVFVMGKIAGHMYCFLCLVFAGVFDGIHYKIENVVIGNGVDHRVAFTPPLHQARIQQNLQPCRDGTNLLGF